MAHRAMLVQLRCNYLMNCILFALYAIAMPLIEVAGSVQGSSSRLLFLPGIAGACPAPGLSHLPGFVGEFLNQRRYPVARLRLIIGADASEPQIHTDSHGYFFLVFHLCLSVSIRGF